MTHLWLVVTWLYVAGVGWLTLAALVALLRTRWWLWLRWSGLLLAELLLLVMTAALQHRAPTHWGLFALTLAVMSMPLLLALFFVLVGAVRLPGFYGMADWLRLLPPDLTLHPAWDNRPPPAANSQADVWVPHNLAARQRDRRVVRRWLLALAVLLSGGIVAALFALV